MAKKEQDLGRASLNHYGSLETAIQGMRSHRAMDLTQANWRKKNPRGSQKAWAAAVRKCVMEGLHYNPGPLNMKPKTLERRETDSFICERIEFNTTPWFRVPGYFYTPKNVKLPAPALVVMHEWGGPMLFGSERVCGEPVHPVIASHRANYTSGRAISDWFASQGYCVVTIDAHHFGHRAPRGIGDLPQTIDPTKLDEATLKDYQTKLGSALWYYSLKELQWAGVTWTGLNYYDDSRSIDYLVSRKEVDAKRIGVTGLSGGGWRTVFLGALDKRVKACVPVGWMTTGDPMQRYNVLGAIGTFSLLPGVWDRLDLPDIMALSAGRACMVVSGTLDTLFPPRGQRDAAKQIASAFKWAGCPEMFYDYAPAKDHCYDAEIQEKALGWFKRWLK